MAYYPHDILRIIDANMNRASEGLRVLEETSRMLFDDYSLSLELKELRHLLRGALADCGGISDSAILSRDSECDVFRAEDTEKERDRKDIRAIVRANASRAQEAVRALEEFIKLICPESAVKFKEIRFRLYSAEKKMVERIDSKNNSLIEKMRVCVVFENFGENVPELFSENFFSNLSFPFTIIIDDPIISDAELIKRCNILAGKIRGRDIGLIVSGRVDCAVIASADGVILDLPDISANDCLRNWGSRFLIGKKACSIEDISDTDVDYFICRAAEKSGYELLWEFPGKTDKPVILTGNFPGIDFAPFLSKGGYGAGINIGISTSLNDFTKFIVDFSEMAYGVIREKQVD
jgi:thiamine-phosphate pyrophosphorylase